MGRICPVNSFRNKSVYTEVHMIHMYSIHRVCMICTSTVLIVCTIVCMYVHASVNNICIIVCTYPYPTLSMFIHVINHGPIDARKHSNVPKSNAHILVIQPEPLHDTSCINIIEKKGPQTKY